MERFIRDVLRRGIKEEVKINEILETSMEKFQAAFTSKGYNIDVNYEFFEQLGDLSINKFIVTYMSLRFPQLKSSYGVGVLANLRILYGSKKMLSKLSEKYGFDKFITCTREEKLDKHKFRNILEDVFEAFFGVLEFSIDRKWFPGAGYIYVYKILENIFDELEININYESLVDAKTRLNELKSEYKFNTYYINIRGSDGIHISEAFVNGKKAGIGRSNIKKNAQIKASEEALNWIEHNLNIKKIIPERYNALAKKIWT